MECNVCNGTGWDDDWDAKCDECGATGEVEEVSQADTRTDAERYFDDVLTQNTPSGVIHILGTPDYYLFSSNQSCVEDVRYHIEPIPRKHSALINEARNKDKHRGKRCIVVFTDDTAHVISCEEALELSKNKRRERIIEDLLGEGWNGVAVNGTPYTQWHSTEEFFTLYKEKKDAVKALGFSLYKHDERGWVVTLFDTQKGDYTSYDAYQESVRLCNASEEEEEEYCDSCRDVVSLCGDLNRHGLCEDCAAQGRGRIFGGQ